MGARIRAFDWSAHPLGPIETWPQSLQVVIRIMLSSRYAMWLGWGPEFYFFCNDAYLPTVGIKESWVLGASAKEVWAEIWPDIGPRAESVVATGEATWDEELLLFLERSGYQEETYHTFSYSPAPDDDGSVGGMLCVVTEVTDRVIGERRLTFLRELGSALTEVETEDELFAALGRHLVARDKDLPFALVYLVEEAGRSARLVSSHNLEAGDALAPLVVDLEAGDAPWPLDTSLRQILSVPLSERFDAIPTGPWDKPSREAVVVPLFEQGQERTTGFLVAGINPYRPLDAEYTGFIELLTGQIAAGLSNARAYEDAQRRAEALAELDRAKTAFFSNVSHEFRTPLTLMLAPLEDSLAESSDDAESRARLELIHRNGLRLLKLVNTLLDFARVEAGRADASYEATDLAALTEDLASVFRSAVERAGLRFVVDCAPLEEPIFVDRDMWEKIVSNLLSNAFKFTFEGEIEVRLAPAGEHVELTVRDTGPGIPAEEVPRLFERFHRVEGARGRTHEGTGIGLALVHELVKLHGGTIKVESEVGRGTTFVVSIPRGRAHLSQDQIGRGRSLATTAVGAQTYVEEVMRWLPADSSGQAALQGFDGSSAAARSKGTASARILLADDNADLREYVRRLLAATYEVEAVADGEAALASAIASPPDLVLTDVMMPKLDGFKLLEKLREDERTKAVPVIMLSARAGEEARVEGLEAGADDYLTKPFSARELLARTSARLEIERVRREGERRVLAVLETLLDQAPLGVYLVDSGFRLQQVNPTARLVFAELGDVIGRDFGDVIRQIRPDAQANEIIARFRHTLETGEGFREPEFVSRRRSGDVLGYFEWQIDRIALPDGELGVVCYFRDISDQVLARRTIAESEERFRTLTQATTSVVWESDPDGGFVAPQEAWERYTGQAWEAHRGFGWVDAIHPDDRMALLTSWTATRERTETFAGEGRVWSAVHGAYRYFEVRAVPIFGRDGSVREWIGTVTDVDDRKSIEREREQALEREQAARVDAEAANRLKDDFLATLSHELRTPLNSMLGWTRLLRSGKLDDATAMRALETIDRNTVSQAKLIEDILDVSRIVTGKLRMSVQPVDLGTVTLAAIDSNRPAAAARGVRIETVLDSYTGTLLGDAERLQQVVWNLVSNAVKFTPKGGKIQVHLERINSHLELSVTDTGQGIAPEFLPHVFDRFRQADGGSTRMFGGLGLGLAIVRHIVELHGGSVSAESPGEGLGATFTVRLPLTLARREVAGPERVSTNDVPASRPLDAVDRIDGVRLLVVDDEEDTRELLRHVLSEFGGEVRTAGSSSEALALLDGSGGGWRPDAILSDIGMPGEDGYALIRAVRSHAEASIRNLPAIALTAYARPEDRLRALASGFEQHLPKPIEPAELIVVIKSLTRPRV
jgi:PAS domain S-box-containing protein